MRLQTVLADDLFHVREDVWLGWARLSPVGFEVRRKGVEMADVVASASLKMFRLYIRGQPLKTDWVYVVLEDEK